MITFTDIIKGKFLEEFSAISLTGALTAISLAFVLSLFIVFIYRATYAGVNYNRNFTAVHGHCPGDSGHHLQRGT